MICRCRVSDFQLHSLKVPKNLLFQINCMFSNMISFSSIIVNLISRWLVLQVLTLKLVSTWRTSQQKLGIWSTQHKCLLRLCVEEINFSCIYKVAESIPGLAVITLKEVAEKKKNSTMLLLVANNQKSAVTLAWGHVGNYLKRKRSVKPQHLYMQTHHAHTQQLTLLPLK